VRLPPLGKDDPSLDPLDPLGSEPERRFVEEECATLEALLDDLADDGPDVWTELARDRAVGTWSYRWSVAVLLVRGLQGGLNLSRAAGLRDLVDGRTGPREPETAADQNISRWELVVLLAALAEARR